MTELLECVDAVLWLLLALILFRGLCKWNKRFSELYNDMEKEIKND